MSPKAIDKGAKKQAILEAAMKVFAQKGFARTRMSEIALQAGIGKGTIYEYFRSKDQIFHEAFHYFIADIEAAYSQIITEKSDAIEKLSAMIEVSINSFLAAGDFGGILMDFWADGIRHHQQGEMEQVFNLKAVYQTYRRLVAKVIDEGIARGQFRETDSQVAASILLGCFDGIMLQYILDPEVLDMRKASTSITQLFLSGLAK